MIIKLQVGEIGYAPDNKKYETFDIVTSTWINAKTFGVCMPLMHYIDNLIFFNEVVEQVKSLDFKYVMCFIRYVNDDRNEIGFLVAK